MTPAQMLIEALKTASAAELNEIRRLLGVMVQPQTVLMIPGIGQPPWPDGYRDRPRPVPLPPGEDLFPMIDWNQ